MKKNFSKFFLKILEVSEAQKINFQARKKFQKNLEEKKFFCLEHIFGQDQSMKPFPKNIDEGQEFMDSEDEEEDSEDSEDVEQNNQIQLEKDTDTESEAAEEY